MATAQSRTREQWEEHGAAAILDFLADTFAAPWSEIEARISVRGWKSFDKVQPVQLSGARRKLREEGKIIEEESNHSASPVRMLRLPYSEGSKREQERLLGRRRKIYRKFLSWTADSRLCGKHAERVVLASLEAAASEAGLYVPKQTVGEVSAINGVDLSGAPLDCWAHVLDTETISRAAIAVFEVKNVHEWIYPDSQELWQLLVSAAPAAASHPVVPVLVCVRYAYTVQNMAMDLGFFVCALRDQVFKPAIAEADFAEVADEFGLLMIRHEGPHEPVTSFLTKIFRRSPPLSQPTEDIEWFHRQAERFSKIAPIISQHSALAEPLSAEARRNVFRSLATNATAAADWPTKRGWS